MRIEHVVKMRFSNESSSPPPPPRRTVVLKSKLWYTPGGTIRCLGGYQKQGVPNTDLVYQNFAALRRTEKKCLIVKHEAQHNFRITLGCKFPQIDKTIELKRQQQSH